VTQDLRAKIKQLTENGNLQEEKPSHRSIFDELLQSTLPPEDKGIRRMADEAQTVIAGGIETTAWALSVATFHIINTPAVYKRLHAELVDAISEPSSIPDLLKLEKLPYLRACITEAVRLSYGASARNTRVLNQPLQYNDWVIPPRTPVGMTVVDVHHDEAVFPNSREYRPERWLGIPRPRMGRHLSIIS
jgi:cytochrome P450